MNTVEFIGYLYKKNIVLDVKLDKLVIQAPKDAVTDIILAELKQKKLELIQYLMSTKVDTSMKIERSNTSVKVLSYAQQRLWLLDQIDCGSAHYNMPEALKLSGTLNTTALHKAFDSIIERHESLRTCFATDESGQPIQVIQSVDSCVVPFIDLSKVEEGARQLQLTKLVAEELGRVFDLSRDLMLRAQLIKVADEEHILLVTMHHIASDGWSISILINEFSALYSAYVQGQENPLVPLQIQYADYAHWQRNWLQGEVLDRQVDYWTKQLASLPVAHSLPLDHPRPLSQTFVGKVYSSHIDILINKSLSSLCQAQGATLFMGLHAAFSVLLSRYSNEKDIVVGSPIANREQAEVAGLIGFFVNTLVLRSDLSENPSFIQLLNQSKTMLLDAYAHQQVPFEQIVERLQPERSLSHSALFQIMLVLQNNEQGVLELPGLTLNPVEQHDTGIAKYDLTLNMIESEEGLQLGWEYNTDLFEQDTIVRMATHFELLLKSLIAQPTENVFKAEMLSKQERNQLLIDWNNTQVDYPKDKCIYELFEAQVEGNPDAIAVVFENEQLTYQQLNEKANQLAHYLVTEKQIKPDTLVGICVERSLEMVIGILAILKAGGAYVPLDPEYPEARLRYMLDDAQLTTVLTQSHLRETTPVSDDQAVCLDDENLQQQLQTQSTQNPSAQQFGLASNHLAYVIYTSGSTGNPKGVLLSHTGLYNLALSQGEKLAITPRSRIVQFASVAFDAATWELIMAFSQGASLILLPSESVKTPDLLSAAVALHQITHATLPPILLPLLDITQWNSVRTLIVAGDACSIQMAKVWSKDRLFINAYGPSETTVCATMGVYTEGQSVFHMGKPINNIQTYVLNEQHVLAPHGVAGELLIGGVGLAHGYLNRDNLTAEKFISNPFYDKKNPASSECLYKTGDLVRWLPDGNLEYLGRIDHQVKIRGFRIELGEIENTLNSHAAVKDVIVLAKESVMGDKRLVAYVVGNTNESNLQDDNEIEITVRHELIESFRHHVSKTLPDYMVPSVFILLESLPLTPNGKVDHKALPEPDLSVQQNTYVAPRTETEKILCEIWQDIIGVERVGITDNFFQLGGHSLLATRLVSRINQRFNVVLPLKALFSTPHLESLTTVILQLDTNEKTPALVSVSREQKLPTSYAQQRLWLLDQIDGGSAHYNIPAALKLSGALDIQSINSAFTSIFERHESLRTCFIANDSGEPVQIIQPAKLFQIPLIDLSNMEEGECQLQLEKCISDEFSRLFDLRADLMLRAQLIKLTDDEHIVLVNMHHIASDGWSMGILINEFSALYSAYVRGQENSLPALPIQYVDYAHWQRNWLQGEVLDEQMSYWIQQLAGLPVVHSLPLDHTRPTLQSFVGNIYRSHIDANTNKVLNQLCQSQGATLFMGLHAAFSVLLSRYSNEKDIVVGSPIANREQAEVAGLIGFFVNTLVLRSDLSENPSFIHLLNQSKTMLLDAYAHQQVPFEQIVERLQPERSLSHSALFQIMLVLQNNEQGVLELPGLTLSPVEQHDTGIAKYDLTLNVIESEEGLQLGWEYNTDLFEQDTIARMATHFELLLKSLVVQPDENVFNVEMLSEQERTQLLIDWNNTQVDYPKDKCIHELFEAQVENNPNAIAVIFENQQLTYQQLNEKANQLAHYLITEKQIKADTLVGICVERSLEMVIGILAILKAGGAYVPLDPDYPEARLSYMLDDAQLTTVLTQSHLRETTPVSDAQAVCLDSDFVKQQLQTYPTTNPDLQVLGLTPNRLAYVIYTSGSTGNPKGVMVEHNALVNRIDWMDRQYGSSPSDRILQKTPFSFDVSVWEFVWPLSVGARIVLAKPEGHKDPLYLSSLIRNQQITKLHFVPSMLGSILSLGDLSQCTWLRQVFCSGEALALHHVESFRSICPWAELHNLYGPTEAAIDVSYWDCAQLNTHLGSVPIGQPINNIQLHVLNPSLALSPYGVAGELHIGGVGVARGYLNREDLTAEKFIPNPFYDKKNPSSSRRLYKTGDLVRWLPDGNLEFLGRIDHQVKIRGFRIELGEIENSLSSHAAVKDVIVLAKESIAGDKRLVAYVVSGANETNIKNDSETEIIARHELIENLRLHVHKTLPDYMVPSAFVLLEQLPLTPNGKVDRKALPEPDISAQQNTYVAPRTETEKILCKIWQELLDVGRVGITDNFFSLGGHSLLVIQVISRIQQQSLSITARQFFSAPRLADLAEAIDSSTTLIPLFKAPANLIPEACEHITPEMLPLVNLTVEDISRIVASIPGGAANVQDIYSLAPLQEGILFHHMMSTKGDPYVMPMLFKVKGRLAVTEFINALQFAIKRHDVLRTAIFWKDLSVPVQVVCRQVSLPVTWLQLDNITDIEMEMRARCAPELQHMELGRAPLLQLQIAVDEKLEQHFILLQIHHLISDHVGLEIIQREIALYKTGKVASLSVPIPYREFVAHTQHQTSHHNQEIFFTETLGDIEEPTAPFNVLDVAGDGSQIIEAKGDIPATVSIQIYTLSKAIGVSPAILFHAAWALIVGVCSGRDDIVFGTVLSGRLQGAIGAENMLGVFINTLPLRVKLKAKTVTELVHEVKLSLQHLLSYEQASLAMAQRCSRLPGGTPLFTAMLNYRHTSVVNDEANVDTAIELIEAHERTNYPFNLSVDDLGDAFVLDVQVDQSINAERVLGYMQTAVAELVKALMSEPDAIVSTLSILPHAERQQLLADWNNTQKDYSKEKCIHELFEMQVNKSPNAIAVIFEGQQLSYRQLNEKSNQLAHYLINEKNIKPDTLVGVCVERSLEMLIGILAILKAGGAYVPLDPDYPEARLKYMLDDAKLTTVLTQSHLCETTPVNDAQAVCLDGDSFKQQLQTQSIENLNTQQLDLNSHHLAYVIYTSGSTGNPKGVMVEHTNVVNFLAGMCDKPGIKINDCLLAVTSTSFDIHGLELFLPLVTGAKLVVAARDASGNPETLFGLIKQHHVSIMQATPATWKMLLEANWEIDSALKVLCGGEALSLHLATELLNKPQLELWNMYGPTETTIWSTTQQILTNYHQILMGQPIANTQIYITTETLELAPVGVAGELLIGGLGVTRGYLNRPELTADKFIRNPFFDKNNPASSERLYKTGDLVRWLPSGHLEFLGRIDHQVKIRGFRIELGEIENILNSHAVIKDAVVVAKNLNATGDKRLVAYVVADVTGHFNYLENDSNVILDQDLIELLRQYLSQLLPDYMIPSVFVLLESLPLTPNGKIDRKALPEPDFSLQQYNYVAPRTENEKILCKIWSEMFSISIEEIGIDSNFFRIGGDSLSAIKFKSIANNQGVQFALKDVMQQQTVEKIAKASILGEKIVKKISAFNVNNKNEISLLPEQRWFFSENFSNPELWNIKSFIPLDFELNYQTALKTLSYLGSIHDALRCKFSMRNGEIIAVLNESIDPEVLHYFDFSSLDEASQEVEIQRICREEQNKFDYLNGPLFSLVLFTFKEGRPPLLFYTFHHLVFDATSVEIFFNDFKNIYFSLLNESNEQLPKKLYSLSSVVEAVENIVADTSNNDRLAYWLRQPFTEYLSYKTDFYCEKSSNVSSSIKTCTGSLGKNETEILLDIVIKRLGFTLLDVIYYAAARALTLINDGNYIPIWHVASGRSFVELNSNVEMDRAIGWFSMPSPRFIKVNENKGVLKSLQETVDCFKEIPDGGCSYLPLFYSNDMRAEKIAFFPDEDKVVFNHLGASDGDISLDAYPDIEIDENKKNYRACLFSCTTRIENNSLKITWSYSENQYKSETIHKLINRFLMELREIKI